MEKEEFISLSHIQNLEIWRKHMSGNIAIVVIAYNRMNSLQNLLASLNKIVTNDKIPLIISIDNNGTKEINKYAQEFHWAHGEKKIIIHKEKLGLRAHFIWAGDQSYLYENIIFLEDDLYVSPYILEYCHAYISKYSNDNRIAGGSFYNPDLCEFDKCKFRKIEDGYDNYFFQHPYWGNIWGKAKWDDFKQWLSTYTYNPKILPSLVQGWGDKSFKKIYIQYLIERDKYIVYPRVSYVTNMGEPGIHCGTSLKQYQTVLQTGHKEFHLSTFDESLSIYDAFFEISPFVIKKTNKELRDFDFVVDIRGNRVTYENEYIITKTNKPNAIFLYSDRMIPLEFNIICNITGMGLFLCKTNHVAIKKRKAESSKKIAIDVLEYNYPIEFSDVFRCLIYSLRKKWISSRFGRMVFKKRSMIRPQKRLK